MSDLSHDSPGVQGLAQLGRNAIERVSELERGIAYRDQTIRQLSEELDDLIKTDNETIAALTLRAEQAERAVELAEGEIAELRAQLDELTADRDEIHRALLMTTDERNRGDRDLHRLRTQLYDHVAVHVAMLRGEIAVQPLAELLHVYGTTFSDLDAANIELAKARETIRQLNKEIDDLIKTDNETIRSLFAYQAKRDETIRQLRAQLDEYEVMTK